jgi:hypothetical protein
LERLALPILEVVVVQMVAALVLVLAQADLVLLF